MRHKTEHKLPIKRFVGEHTSDVRVTEEALEFVPVQVIEEMDQGHLRVEHPETAAVLHLQTGHSIPNDMRLAAGVAKLEEIEVKIDLGSAKSQRDTLRVASSGEILNRCGHVMVRMDQFDRFSSTIQLVRSQQEVDIPTRAVADPLIPASFRGNALEGGYIDSTVGETTHHAGDAIPDPGVSHFCVHTLHHERAAHFGGQFEVAPFYASPEQPIHPVLERRLENLRRVV